eukprot:GHVU01127652.1.p2 GENE.GHVU01127652.1~~GHVU01127652.1.p2  ORF type:complete len:130 (+),score=10.87 GHVU01127652.1:890-1279(+)
MSTEQKEPLYELTDTRNRISKSQYDNIFWFFAAEKLPSGADKLTGAQVEHIIRKQIRHLNMTDNDLLLSITPGRTEDSTTAGSSSSVKLLKEASFEKDTRIFTIVVVDSNVRLLHLIDAIGRLHGPLTD